MKIDATKIFIYGPPGVGKSTAGPLLGPKLGLPVIEGDLLRDVLAKRGKSVDDEPFLFVGVKQAWRQFGPLTEENVIKGLRAVRKETKPYVEEVTAKHPGGFIFEGTCIDPNDWTGSAEVFLVTTADKTQHHKQYYARRPENTYTQEGFIAARIIQDYLINEALYLPVKIIQNYTTIEAALKQFNH